MSNIIPGKKVIEQLLDVQEGEKVLLILDKNTDKRIVREIGEAIDRRKATLIFGVVPIVKKKDANAMSPKIEKLIRKADAIIGATTSSIASTYSKTLLKLLKQKKTRHISMIHRNYDNWTNGGAKANYKELYKKAKQLEKRILRSRILLIKTKSGTELLVSLKGVKPIIECGYATKKGETAAFSDGEISFMPENITGKAVIDGPIAFIGKPEHPVVFSIDRKRVKMVEGGKEAKKIRRWIRELKNIDNIAEVGIGLNPKVRKNIGFQEAKKGAGNVHIALGDDIFYYGKTHSPLHVDMVIYDAKIKFIL